MALDKPRPSRDNEGDGTNSRAAWWYAGHVILNDDPELRRGNLGLGSRERQALSEENDRPWNHPMFSKAAIVHRAKRAIGGQEDELCRPLILIRVRVMLHVMPMPIGNWLMVDSGCSRAMGVLAGQPVGQRMKGLMSERKKQ